MTEQRRTSQKAAILHALEYDDRPLSPKEILEISRAEVPSIGVATVYRTIKRFLEEEIIEAVELPGPMVRYVMVGKTHHQHFQCRYCDKVYNVQAPSSGLDALLPHGYSMENHEIMIVGKCADCGTAHG